MSPEPSHHITEAVRKSGETYVFYARKIEVESTTFKSWIGRNSFPFGYLDSIRILFTDLETSDVQKVMDGGIDDFIKAYLMEFSKH